MLLVYLTWSFESLGMDDASARIVEHRKNLHTISEQVQLQWFMHNNPTFKCVYSRWSDREQV
ncbi:hypothetical protein NC653_028920 [Populus alba x Populus x berolinensis]|uniref:Uncharacterized protein n=1 Tax=Populus alba x Populus x berolinensis TaxID=444605 RepID=A0AAD6M3N5_9ROSI|nr:hypothetical protein NC653_028920 [Populus alba x Populus x berolinensis]